MVSEPRYGALGLGGRKQKKMKAHGINTSCIQLVPAPAPASIRFTAQGGDVRRNRDGCTFTHAQLVFH